MTGLRASRIVPFGAVAPPARFEIAFFSSSDFAMRALAGEAEETRALRGRSADPPAMLIPTGFGRRRKAGAS